MADTTSSTSTSSSTSEVALTENRPRVVSVIQNENVTYQTSSSNLKLFSAFVSEKGVDNKVQKATTTSEYSAKYGSINLKKYGQEGYNNMNWLAGGGEISCLRVMPDNAGFSHAFLNIQTRVETKSVLDKDGNKIEYDDVTLRPTICFTDTNNTTETLLEYELDKDRTDYTVDGYKNHLLFTVYPEGRGKYYNKLGFRITLNTQYDDMYDFRVYNFEVVEYSDNNVADIKEGPFYVSFNPDALSYSNESLFIEDVINSYSSLLKCKFNDTEFVKMATIINPDVNPFILDPLFCKTRTVNDAPETFFSSKTSKFEDVHMAIQKYDVNGNALYDSEGVIINNVVDTADLIEQSITIADNTYRQEKYNRYSTSIANMKTIFNSISSNKYMTLVDELLLTLDGSALDGGTIKAKLESLDTYKTDIQNLIIIFNSSFLDSDFQKVVNKNKEVATLIGETVTLMTQLLDYHKSLQTDAFTLETETLINNAIELKNLKDILDIRAVAKKEALNDLSNTILELKASGDKYDQEDQLPGILSDLRKLIDYLSLTIAEYGFSDTELQQLIADYNTTIDKYNSLGDVYISSTAKTNLLAEIYANLSPMINSAYNVCTITICDTDLLIVNQIIDKDITPAVAKLMQLTFDNKKIYATKVATTAGIAELTSSIRKNMDNASTSLSSLKSILYTNQLQDFNNPVRMANGSDGDLDESNATLRAKTIKSLLVKAYTGLIDIDVTNKRILPINFIIDANYSIEVKNAIATLAKDIRRDFLFIADVGFQTSAEATLTWRKANFPVSSNLIAIYGHDFVVYDEYNARDMRVTMPYFMATKIPSVSAEYGLQYPMAGNKRGVIDGFKSINFVPNDNYAESLYNNRINYVLSDEKRTKLMSQLTSAAQRTPLSDINNLIMTLQIKRDVEVLAEDYQFEFEDDDTMKNMQYAINNYLNKYIDNRACDEISAKVYASDYDKTQHILRVNISIKFKNIVEIVVITLDIAQ